MAESFARTWKEIATGFLQVGATAYGGPAIMGVMQAEFQERRQWTSKPHFLEGLALVNVLPGATATQLGIFLGHARGGWWGGLLAGLCFAAPGFIVMLGLTMAYAAFGVSPILRGALYGLGPVVLAIFFAALFRLGKSALRSRTQGFIAIGAAAAALLSPLGAAAILMLAAYVGYKVLGVGGAVVAAAASFLPSFILMLALLPVFARIRTLAWARAVMQGLVPGVIGVMAVALVRMTPHAAPDLPAIAALVVTGVILIARRLAPLKAMLGGSVFGILRDRVCELAGVRTVVCVSVWGR